MRKVIAVLMALGFVMAVSGVAFAGGADGMCSYSQAKQVAAEKVDTNKPVAKKSDTKTVMDKLLLAQKKQASKPVASEKK